MVDLKGQYDKIQGQVDAKIKEVIASTAFIKGKEVLEFEHELASYLGVKHVISCGNGTDALQIAMMGLDLQPGDEVITADFTFAATVEVIGLLGLKAVLIDVNPKTFTLDIARIKEAITPRTKAIVPVHLFGQTADMEAIMSIAQEYNLYVIEDNAQAIGADFTFSNGLRQKSGTIGHIGTTSFFPSKNLGAYGDGGALFTNDDALAQKLRSITNHGMSRRYYYERLGVNSRLDSLQAAVLRVKLPLLDTYAAARRKVAAYYDAAFKACAAVRIPEKAAYSTHVYHQYTLVVEEEGKRDALHRYLLEKEIPNAIYYPVPLHRQKAYRHYRFDAAKLSHSIRLSQSVLSLPIHTEMDEAQLEYITNTVLTFFK